jgi:CPA1 family monovalent cation:H+ antiporter
VTVVFLLNAFIFVEVGVRFHQIVLSLRNYSVGQLVWWGAAVAVTCILVRIIWTFAQGLLPITNEPEHVEGKADWSHVAVLAWTGMRGGVSLAAALAIPLETRAGHFPQRDLLIFLTFCVLLATLVMQGSTLPALIRWLGVKDDGAPWRDWTNSNAGGRFHTRSPRCTERASRHGSRISIRRTRLQMRFAERRNIERPSSR